MRKILLPLCMGVLLCAAVGAQDFFVKDWEKTYSTDKQKEIIKCMDVGDLDNDGVPDIVLGLNVRPYAGQQKYAVQIVNRKGEKKQRWDSTYLINDVAIVDVNDDGTPEILVSSADLYVLSNKAQNLNYPPVGTVVFASVAYDLDGDGKKELLIGTRELQCKGETLNWNVSIGTQIKKIFVGDINWDTFPEIVVLTRQNVIVMDREGKKLWISPGTQDLRDMTVSDIDGDKNMEILFSTDNMLILMWEARDDGMEGEINLKSYKADFLAVSDLNKDGSPEIIIASSIAKLEVLDLKGNSLWLYEAGSAENVDVFSDIFVSDLDGDTWTDILVAFIPNYGGAGIDSFLYLMKNQFGVSPPKSAGTDYYNRGVALFNEGKCAEAVPLFTQAQTAFQGEGNGEMASQCQTYIDQCTQILTKQAEADSKVLQAEELVQQGKIEDAVTLFEEARALYQELGNSEKVEWIAQRITEIQSTPVPPEETPEVSEKKSSGRGLILVAVVAAVIVISFFVVKTFRKGGVETEKKLEKPEKREKPEKPGEKETVSERIKEEERKLKAKFVYGEINREEYREQLKNLYKDENK